MKALGPILERLDARALVVVGSSGRDPAMAPFVGPVKLGRAFVVVPRGSPPRLGFWTPMEREEAARTGLDLLTPADLDVARWARDAASPGELLADVLSRALHLSELAPGRLAVAGSVPAGELLEAAAKLATEGWELVAGEPLVAALRKRKTPDELAEVRRVSAGVGEAFRHVAGLLAAAAVEDGELWLGGERLRVARLRHEVARVFADHSLEQPEGGLCAPAEEGAVPHNPGTPERVLLPGEALVVDLYPKGSLFTDCTRTFCVGEPPPALAAAHALVREALELARSRIVAGCRGFDLQRAVCERFAAAGHATLRGDPRAVRGYVHGLGHGVGYEVHERPFFKEESTAEEGVLEEGDVFTLEPGLYDPEAGFGVRLEDLHHLGPGGVEVLTPLPYDLDPRAW